MDITTLKRVLPILTKHNIVPLLWGAQGIGKTQTIKQFAKEHNLGFVHLHLATQEVGDLVGLLVHNDDGTVRHARPEWMPTEGKGILFLDEIARAPAEVIQCCFSLITEKTIHTHKIPDGWKIVAAANYQSNKFTQTDTSDAAWMSRFLHIDVKPSVTEFVTLAETRKADSIANFISDNPTLIESKDDEGFDFNSLTPDRRSLLEMVAPLEREYLGDAEFELYKGILGAATASMFVSYKAKAQTSLKLKDILNNYKVVRSRVKELANIEDTVRFDMLTQPVDDLLNKLKMDAQFINDDNIDNLKQFFIDIPSELAMKAFKAMNTINFAKKNAILNDPEFVKVITSK